MTPWTIAHQDPLSMEFSRQVYWTGSLWPTPRDFPDQEIKPLSPELQVGSLLSELPSNKNTKQCRTVIIEQTGMCWEKTQQLALWVIGPALCKSPSRLFGDTVSGAVSWRKEWKGIYLSGALPILISHWSTVAPHEVNPYTYLGCITWDPWRVFWKALQCGAVLESGSDGWNQMFTPWAFGQPQQAYRKVMAETVRSAEAPSCRWSQKNPRKTVKSGESEDIPEMYPRHFTSEWLRSIRPSHYILFQIIIWGVWLFFENKMPWLLPGKRGRNPVSHEVPSWLQTVWISNRAAGKKMGGASSIPRCAGPQALPTIHHSLFRHPCWASLLLLGLLFCGSALLELAVLSLVKWEKMIWLWECIISKVTSQWVELPCENWLCLLSHSNLGFPSHVSCVDEARVGAGPPGQALLPFAAPSLATVLIMVLCWLSGTGLKQACKQESSADMPLGRGEFIKGSHKVFRREAAREAVLIMKLF